MNLLLGDCLEVLRTLPDSSVDSLVTDPPAGISFMNSKWDCDKGGRDHWIKWMAEVMRECMRVMKPGAHGLVWALPRTSHWTATALEDAGFEVRDCVTHLFATGFPKSLNVVKALEKDLQCALYWQPVSNALESLNQTLLTPETDGSGSALENVWVLVKDGDQPIRVESVDASSIKLELIHPAPIGVNKALFAISAARLNGKSVWSARLIQIGKAVDSSDPTAMWLYEAKTESIDSSTISLLRSSLGGESSRAKTFTTLTEIVQTTGLRIFNFFQSPSTLSSIASVNHTALKPAAEFWWLIRKPCSEKTVAANVLKHGCGAINIDASRIGHATAEDLATSLSKNPGRSEAVTSGVYGSNRPQQVVNTAGRFPANLVLSHSPNCTELACDMFDCPVAELDRQSGNLGKSAGGNAYAKNRKGSQTLGAYKEMPPGVPCGFGDSGGASRFFYCAKISSSERNAGLEAFEEKEAQTLNKYAKPSEGRTAPKCGGPKKNHHPTVKPKKLMAYLIRLITPPGGTVLDPFAGSGSTGVAAKEAGFDAILIERELEYYEIMKARIAGAKEKA